MSPTENQKISRYLHLEGAADKEQADPGGEQHKKEMDRCQIPLTVAQKTTEVKYNNKMQFKKMPSDRAHGLHL